MAKWNTNTKHSASSINNGNRYEIQDRVTLEQLNAITENSFYASEKVDTVISDAQDVVNQGKTEIENTTSQGKNELNSIVDDAEDLVKEANSYINTVVGTANEALFTVQQVVASKGYYGSNPNLLINGDFIVNQRGQPSYGKGYTVDRWQSSLTYLNFDVASKTLTNNDTTYSGYFIQYIENQEDLYGKTVTFSSLVNGTRYSLTATIHSDTTVSTVAYTSIKENNITKCQLEIGFTNNLLNVRYAMPVGQSVTIGEAKLEIGSVATAFSPRPYAEELAMCQRYYLPLMNGASVYNGFIFTETSARISVPVPTTMRLRTPTAEFNVGDISQCKIYSNGTQVTPTALVYAGFVDSDQFVINATIPNATPNHTCAMRLLGSASLDAEIY